MIVFRKTLVIISLFAKRSIINRASIFSGALIYSTHIFVFVSLWKYIENGVIIANYSLSQIIWYLICTEFIMFACRTNVFNQITIDVRTGDIAYNINRPVNYIAYNLASSCGNNVITVCIYAVISLCLGLVFNASLPPTTVYSFLAFLFSLFVGVSIQLLLQICIGLSALYLGDNTAILLIYQKLVFLLGGFFPTSILPLWLQRISALLPFQYVAGGPANIFVAFSWSDYYKTLLVQLLYLFILVLLTLTLLKKGLRRIQINGG